MPHKPSSAFNPSHAVLYLKNAWAERKDGDLLAAITEGMSRIAAPMIVVASGLAVASGLVVASKLVVVSRSVVASGLAPRWAAKQPQ